MRRAYTSRKIFWLIALHTCLFVLIFIVVRVHAASLLDARVVEAFANARTPTVTVFMNAVTSVGNAFAIILIVSCATLAFLFTKRHKSLALGLVLAVLGAKATEVLLKILIERDRPDTYALFHLDTYSFPSGHATATAALFGYLGLVLVDLYPQWRLSITILAGVLILLVGVSRIYLGVHYPSDIIGGYLVGAVWILVGVWVVKYART